MPPSIWPSTGLRVDRLADVLRGADPDDAREAELDVDLGDDPHRARSEGDVRAVARDLAGLGIERRRARVAVDALDVDLARRSRAAPRARARQASPHRAGGHPRHPRRRRRAGRVDAVGRARREHDVLGAELGARDLEDHARHALADLGGGAVHLGGEPSGRAEPHARGAVVVEALRVADVLEADREADAAPDALAARRVAGAAGQPQRVARQLLGRAAARARRRARITSATGSEPVIRWPVGSVSPGAERVQQPQLDRVDPERGGELVHLRLARRSSVCTAPKPRIAPQGGLFV